LTQDDLLRVDPVQYSATKFIGKRGVEAFYEEQLHGAVGYQKAETDAFGRVRRTLDEQSPSAGRTYVYIWTLSCKKRASKPYLDAVVPLWRSILAAVVF
jgi:penicillin-binding protein 2